jgi:hypothetical protein
MHDYNQLIADCQLLCKRSLTLRSRSEQVYVHWVAECERGTLLAQRCRDAQAAVQHVRRLVTTKRASD